MKYWGIFFLFTLNIWAQNTTLIQGKIFDQSSQIPLDMVYVVAVENQDITFSNEQGIFQITVEKLPATLSIQYLGYLPQKIQITQSQFLNIGLQATDFHIEEIVLTSYKGEQKFLEIPAPISFLSPKDLSNNNHTNIVSALNRSTGIFMHAGALNTNRLTIRGIGSRSLFSTTKIRAYFNDIPLSSGEVETTIEDIDPALLERVEVIKGPAASLYGANLGGVVQLIGKKVPYYSQNLQTHFTVGSFGLLKNATSFQMSNAEMNLTLAYQNLHSDGYRDNNEYNRQAFTTLGSFYLSPKTSLNILASLIDLEAFIPSSLGQTDYDNEPTKAAFTWGNVEGFEDYQKGLVGIGLQHTMGTRYQISSNIFSNFKNSYELRPFNILRENNIAYGNRTLLSYQQNNRKSDLKIIIGNEFFHEKYNWNTYEVVERNTGEILSDNAEIRQAYNIFGQVSWELKKTKTQLLAGLNYGNLNYQLQDFYQTDSLDQSGEYRFEAQWSPRLAIRQTLKKNTSIYATLSHGYSPPSLEETLTPEGQINLDIQPETGYNYELGIRGNYLNRHWWIDASIFYMPVRNLIVAQRIAEDQYQGQNAGKTNHIGLEFFSRYRLPLNLNKLENIHFSFAYTYADYRFKEFINNDIDFAEKSLPGIAPHRLNIGLDWEWKWGWYGNIQYLFVDEMPMNDANELYASNYSLLDLKTGFRKRLFKKLEADIYGGINNVLDEKYASMILVNARAFGNNEARFYYPGLPINYYGGLKLNWQF